MTEMAVIATLTLVFAVAAALLLATSRTGLPVIPFYLLAGIAIGWAIQEALLVELAQWGIAFLVFAFAVEVDPIGGRRVRLDAALIGILQIAITAGLLYGLSILFGLDPLTALVVAIAGSLSSTLVALGHLQGQPVRPTVTHERLGETIHFVEDLIAIGIVLVLSAIVYAETGAPWRIAVGIGLVLTGFLVRLYLFDRITSFAGDDVEILMLTGVSLLIGFIALAEAAGISVVVGAFAAGVAIPYEYPHDIDTLDAIGYLEDFFVPIFFVTVGALVTFPDLPTLGLALVLYLSVTILNPAIVAWLALWRDYDSRSATLTGLNLDQISEFSLIIAIEALFFGVIARGVFDAIVLAAVASMITSTYTHTYGPALYQRLIDLGVVGSDLDAIAARSTVPDSIENHVLVVGFGPHGQQVVEASHQAGYETVVIEADPALIDSVREAESYHVWGDAMSASTWELARPETAALVVSTAPDRERNRRAIEWAGDVDVIVHADDPAVAGEYLDAGALFVAVPTLLAGEHVAQHVGRVLTDGEYRNELRETGRTTVERTVTEP